MGAAAVFENPNSITRPISPCRELGAHEALCTEQGSSFRSIAERFGQRLGSISSDFVPEDEAFRYAATVRQTLSKAGVKRFGIRVHGAGDYPKRLRNAEYPVEFLYFKGWWAGGGVTLSRNFSSDDAGSPVLSADLWRDEG